MQEPDVDLIEALREMSARRLVRWLTTPALSGFYLSPADLERVGADLEVRIVPFGRANGLEQLLRGAALDGKLQQALGALRSEMASQLEQYRTLEFSALDDWIKRGTATLDAWVVIEDGFDSDPAPVSPDS